MDFSIKQVRLLVRFGVFGVPLVYLWLAQHNQNMRQAPVSIVLLHFFSCTSCAPHLAFSTVSKPDLHACCFT
jgi:hypothetical protein